jgi:cytochrome c biogenesis protein CcmG, thiol:disulfide interchange protein DsbE
MGDRMIRRMTQACAASLLITLAFAGCDRGSHPQNIGLRAPEFVVSDGRQTVDLNKLRGHIVVLNLWASWCAPCVAETPSLIALQQQMPDVVVVGISMDENEDAYRRFLERSHVNFLTVRDPTARVNALYGTAQIPETYIIDQRGVLRRKFVSDQDWTSPEIVSYLKKLDS